jgi:hypothetical protein
MNLKKTRKINNEYKTTTTILTILDSKLHISDEEMEGFFDDDAIKMKFKTEEGTIFSQKLEIVLGENSVLHQIISSTGLDNELEDIKPELFIGKSCKAVIATKKDWKRAFIVAVF